MVLDMLFHSMIQYMFMLAILSGKSIVNQQGSFSNIILNHHSVINITLWTAEARLLEPESGKVFRTVNVHSCCLYSIPGPFY